MHRLLLLLRLADRRGPVGLPGAAPGAVRDRAAAVLDPGPRHRGGRAAHRAPPRNGHAHLQPARRRLALRPLPQERFRGLPRRRVPRPAWTGPLRCPPGAPLGTGLGLTATLCREQLKPGDRLVLYTDGITETRDPGGEEFGLERFLNFVIHHNADGMPVPETLRRLVHSILDYHQGRLQDDATVLLLEWRGPEAGVTGTDVSTALRTHSAQVSQT
ncbi:SpoIIE family protein phosphatase [Streptomyces mexicanus]|uniref:SpoIIE family protein phosphatase n=1 Tax=Streptomyces mexicanus TaxID=178566 RepID=A0A7X1I616_9ACTN|nr:SpoIIE family protein phosphatase [Streptomyces mexicanus]